MFEVVIHTPAGSQVLEFGPNQVWEMQELMNVLEQRAVSYTARTDRVIVGWMPCSS